MDILSEAIGSVRIGRAQTCRVRESGSWGIRFPAFAGSGFNILLRGSAWLITATGRPRALKAGDVVLTPFGAEYGLSHAPSLLQNLSPAGPHDSDPADVDILCGAYWLDHGQVHPFLRALPEVIAVSSDHGHTSQLRSLANLLAVDVSDTQPGSGATRAALLDLLLTHVLRQWLEQNRDVDRPEVGDPAIAVALREIHSSPHKPWTVQQLGETVGMSRTAFTKRFTALVGKPPMTYLTGWRLSYGARLLRETKAPLAAIARQVGYSTEFAFGAAFRREYGISPGRFRSLESRQARGA
ncbi:AraC family transcriptional regulator [Streptomyces sp. HC44]|uniref:AraC family transcriptional regulator n=1 Tax=Streptomyces scabichelini TaxID=2711217 RepID=A0A6G4V2M1_9ACTN|nr:AraC family transcriptional regulator [Streptomyces scabichelini]NGO08269.1 AraC family transcriptional regulator [Streptomyces scabichelini]